MVTNSTARPAILSPRDAWKISKLLANRDLNGELADISESVRPLVTQLAETSPEKRRLIWDGFLTAHPHHRDDIIQVVANAKPDEPAPPIEANEPADDWGPMRLGALPRVEPFPLDVLPLVARQLAEAAARSISCPVDFPAAAILAVASGVIGRSACLLIKPGYFASASLYLALVGGPSSGKSPALRAALAPVWSISENLYDEWRRDMEKNKKSKAFIKEHEKARKELELSDEPEGTVTNGDAGCGGAEQEKPVNPDKGREKSILRRVVTTDPTTEALGPILAQNPRAMIVAPDELTKWVLSMDQYKGGKGGDRPFYLSAWNGEPVYVDRAKNKQEPIVVPHPFLTVAGGLTPDMISALPEGHGRDDGFIPRLLFAYPDRIARGYSEQGIPDDMAAEWKRMVESLWFRPMRDLEGRPAPWVVKMTTKAAQAWSVWCQAHYAEQEADDFLDSFEGVWGKLEFYAARLALILHLMELANDPTRQAPDDPPDLKLQTLQAAFRLVAYFKSHALRVHTAIGGRCDNGGDEVQMLVRWIRRNELAEFSERDVTRNLRRFRDDPDVLAASLGWMTDHNLIRPREEPVTIHKRGRKPSSVYEVNPRLTKAPQK
jgi:hypothetical protein